MFRCFFLEMKEIMFATIVLILFNNMCLKEDF